ncbi:CDP-glucose 4,6-dehydratase [Synechococcus sp. UW179A]|uniref:CDP-glucose 4,6-dehydratase n=1 Tax=Synechococcus sp. UW179A TaxID=2575510 RepID=UPI000E0F0B47|nr:CDP-glucose 4,6-dehydratase [Synechococcus sp. UW179A]
MSSFSGLKVFVTGHTGFKGAWLASWLLRLGANVDGYALPPCYENSLFETLDLEKKLHHTEGDIRDYECLSQAITKSQPDVIFHLAAQAIVSTSYLKPIETISTNVIGTANLLDCIRKIKKSTQTVLITSDKSYFNAEWPWGYRETDRIGGKDIYSGSKGAAEIIIQSYLESYFKNPKPHSIAVARAGNVIGGGDWASDRLIPDIYRSWASNLPVEIRCPQSTRPWQHVLEPIGGYLKLAYLLRSNTCLHGEAFNFGPSFQENKTVLNLITDLANLSDVSPPGDPYLISDNIPFDESSLLKLNCDKAQMFLKWNAVLSYSMTLKYVQEWYDCYMNDPSGCAYLVDKQISNYTSLINEKFLSP